MIPTRCSKRTTRHGWWALGVTGIILVFLTIQCTAAVDPLLYTARNESITEYHEDLVVTGDLTRSDAALVLQEWQACLNLTGHILHKIKVRDLDSAKSDLETFYESGQSLRLLVEHLDLTETEVATFENDNRANIRSLEDLRDQVQEFDGLQDELSVHSSKKNLTGLKSVELKGETLRTEIRGKYEGYTERANRIIGISKRFGLDTSIFEMSVTDFSALMAAIDTLQDARSVSIQELILGIRTAGNAQGTNSTDRPESTIHLAVLPEYGVYGDSLELAGSVDGPAGTSVTVLVDGRRLKDVVTGSNGRFSVPYVIQKVAAGSHTAYASTGSDISEVSNFTVGSRNTTITLAVEPVEDGSKRCKETGRLMTEDGVPVRGARVYVDVDSRGSWDYGITGDKGEFNITSDLLSPGSHTLKARFDPDGVPLLRSESKPVTIVVSNHLGWAASLVYLLGAGIAVAGSVLFLRKRQAPEEPAPTGAFTSGSHQTDKGRSAPTIHEAHQMTERFTVTVEGRIDGYETIARTYLGLVQQLEEKNPHLKLRSCTPRKLAAQLADEPYGDQLAELVRIHEKVRYADHDATESDLQRVREAFIEIITGENGVAGADS